MDLNYKQEITVGTMVLVGIGLFVGGAMWLKGTKIGREHLLRVEFDDVGCAQGRRRCDGLGCVAGQGEADRAGTRTIGCW